MKTALVFKPATPEVTMSLITLSDAPMGVLAKAALDAGMYALAVTTPPMVDAEAVFDWVNMESGQSMNPGAVIVWADGRRELCLNLGWAAI